MAFQYERRLKSGITIVNTDPEQHAEALGALQPIVFPTLAPEELMFPQHYAKHVELFAEGQFAALNEQGEPIASTSSILQKFDFDHPNHTFAELLQDGWMTSHDPDGDWLYGMDVAVHPDYRRMGIARGLYRARQDTVQALGLKGQLAGGMMIGYGAYKDTLTPQAYFKQLQAGEVYDPTVSTQMRIGFEARALLPDYVTDPTCDNYGVLIVLDADKTVASE